jgi:hypothetical protein
MNFILFTNQGYPLQNSSLGQLHSDGGVVSIAVLEGFCWNTFQLVGYALLDIIQSTKMAPFQVVFEPPYSCQIVIKLEFSRQILEKSSNSKCQENAFSGSRTVPCGHTRSS